MCVPAYSRSRLSRGSRGASVSSFSLCSSRSTLSSGSGLTIKTLWENQGELRKCLNVNVRQIFNFFDKPNVSLIQIHQSIRLTGGPANPGGPGGPTSPRSPCRGQAFGQRGSLSFMMRQDLKVSICRYTQRVHEIQEGQEVQKNPPHPKREKKQAKYHIFIYITTN